jgi:hypothetical protein
MPATEPEPVAVQGGPSSNPNGQPAPQRKPPKAVQKKQEQQPAAVNEQTPFFE